MKIRWCVAIGLILLAGCATQPTPKVYMKVTRGQQDNLNGHILRVQGQRDSLQVNTANPIICRRMAESLIGSESSQPYASAWCSTEDVMATMKWRGEAMTPDGNTLEIGSMVYSSCVAAMKGIEVIESCWYRWE